MITHEDVQGLIEHLAEQANEARDRGQYDDAEALADQHATVVALRDGLREALDAWDTHDRNDCSGIVDPRIAELRKLVTP